MLDTIKKYIGFIPQHLSELKQGSEIRSFILSYKQKDIGYLEFRDDKWTFHYSEWFKSQGKLVPLLEFPDVEKTYYSEKLWPFFASRIPSKVNRDDTTCNDNGETLSLADLLEKFGRKTINNPFILEPS